MSAADPPMYASDHDLLIAIATKLDAALKSDADQESRIRALERKLYVATGAAGMMGAVVGWLMQVVGH